MAFKLGDSLATQIAKHLSEKIVRSELKAGGKIEEDRIAEELGVSRVPIREAMRILERDRLVDLIPGRGVWVSEMTDDFVAALFGIMGELYALGARRFVENSDDEEFRPIYAALERLEGCAKHQDTIQYYAALMEYASTAKKSMKTPLLEQLLEQLEQSFRRALYASVFAQAGELKKHATFIKRITESIRKRNGDSAAKAVRAFFRHEKEFVLKSFESRRGLGGGRSDQPTGTGEI